ncbi:MAG: hypothetical protein DMF85_03970 [Acidobacteria bacterium]|nr:MAG: hypothetical protein DMF85_03970 [Acidobacteriota bacterium]
MIRSGQALTAVAVTVAALALPAGPTSVYAQRESAPAAPYRTLNDRFAPPVVPSLDVWKTRATYLREHILASAGLLPMPAKTPLNPVVFGDVSHPDYVVSKVYFESLPGFFVTGNLYRPVGSGPFPAIASPHGHWTYGRLENTDLASVPGRAINLARQGFVVFTYDMIGYDDSRQLTHTFGGRRENLWGLSLAGLQLWNSIRTLDFFDSLPYVRHDGYGATGASGGGTQTFLLAAVDDRVAFDAPVNMISTIMQGGSPCENSPGLPRPLLMVSATGDWTAETMEAEYPAVRKFYELFGAESHVKALRIDAPHNYNRESREAVYAWMARWLQQASADARVPERSFHPDPLADLMVFYGRPLPSNAVTAPELTARWIAAAKAQLTAPNLPALGAALRHVLGFSATTAAAPPVPSRNERGRTVLLATSDAELERLLRRAGFNVRPVMFTPFDAARVADGDPRRGRRRGARRPARRCDRPPPARGPQRERVRHVERRSVPRASLHSRPAPGRGYADGRVTRPRRCDRPRRRRAIPCHGCSRGATDAHCCGNRRAPSPQMNTDGISHRCTQIHTDRNPLT